MWEAGILTTGLTKTRGIAGVSGCWIFFFNISFFIRVSVQFSSVTQSCPTLCEPMDCSTLGLPVPHRLPEFARVHIHSSAMLSHRLILCHSLLLLPSIFPSIRVFSSDSALHIRCPKYWRFSFSISSSSEYSGLISFRIDWFDLAVQGTLRCLL